MALLVQCPNPACKTSRPLAEPVSDHPGRCPKCGNPFVVKPTLDGQKNDTKKDPPASNANPFPDLPAEFGPYSILQLLGRGGMGAVYLARDSRNGRRVALKVPIFGAAAAPTRVERFLREARVAAALNHPNICAFVEAGQIDGRPFLAMAYIVGATLRSKIDPDVPMSQVRAAEIAYKVALALDHAHRKGIIHRDLKPANVMMTPNDDGDPVVLDFGLAKQVGGAGSNADRLTLDGAVLGTPSYMAPEQIQGDIEAIGPATDVYALGVILFEMLTGRPPYMGAQRVVMGRILVAPIPSVLEFRPDADALLDATCRMAMAKKREGRFSNMAQLANVLGYYLKTRSASPPPPGLKKTKKRIEDLTVGPGVLASLMRSFMKNVKTKRFLIIALVLPLAPLALSNWLEFLTTSGERTAVTSGQSRTGTARVSGEARDTRAVTNRAPSSNGGVNPKEVQLERGAMRSNKHPGPIAP
jgi:serine/threonine protein kinase